MGHIAKLCDTVKRKILAHRQGYVRVFGSSRTYVHSSSLAGVCATAGNSSKPLERSGFKRQAISSLNVYNHHGGRFGLLARSFGCSSSVQWTHEVEEEFDAEPCKHVRSYSNNAGNDGYRMSVRIEPPMVGILDKELLRKRRTLPFTERRSLGVGLYRDKLRDRKNFSSVALALSDQEEPPRGSPILKTQTVNLTNTSCRMQDSLLQADEEYDVLGVVDTDSKEEEEDYSERRRPALSTMIKEENLEALEICLREMEASLPPDDRRLGTTCLRLAQLYDSADEDPDKILSYVQRALKILEKDMSFETAMCYHVIGSAYYKDDDSKKAISYLKCSTELLEKVSIGGANDNSIGTVKYAVQALLGHSKMSIGKQEEAMEHYMNGVVINEGTLEPGNPDLARSYQQAAEAFTEAEKYEDARTLCLKALPIYANHYGSCSLEVAVVRRLMALIYDDMEDFEKLLLEHEIIRTKGLRRRSTARSTL